MLLWNDKHEGVVIGWNNTATHELEHYVSSYRKWSSSITKCNLGKILGNLHRNGGASLYCYLTSMQVTWIAQRS